MIARAGDPLMTDQSQPENPNVSNATTDEAAIAFSGPALFTNKFYLSGMGANVRLAFAEQSNKTATPIFRAAVIMTTNDLVQLRNVIDFVLSSATKAEPKPKA
jgi:hypothetical protein